MYVRGDTPRNRLTTPEPFTPDARTAAVPTTGSAAAIPGNAVAALNAVAANPMATIPASATRPRTVADIPGSRGTAMASPAPIPSSQIRSQVRK